MTGLIKSMYGRPSSERALFQGTSVLGWHIEDGEGGIVPVKELSDGEIEKAYGNEFREQPGMAPGSFTAEPVYAKIGGIWHEISAVDSDGRAVTRELGGADALYLAAASQIEYMTGILLVMNDGDFGSMVPRDYIRRRFSESVETFVRTAMEVKK